MFAQRRWYDSTTLIAARKTLNSLKNCRSYARWCYHCYDKSWCEWIICLIVLSKKCENTYENSNANVNSFWSNYSQNSILILRLACVTCRIHNIAFEKYNCENSTTFYTTKKIKSTSFYWKFVVAFEISIRRHQSNFTFYDRFVSR